MNSGDEEELVSVAHPEDRVEAEMIQGLLGSGGIPSVLQQVGIDGPALGIGWLNPAGGSRLVMVRASQSEQARALLTEALVEGERIDWEDSAGAALPEAQLGRGPRDYGLVGAYARVWTVSLAVMFIAFAVFLLLRLV